MKIKYVFKCENIVIDIYSAQNKDAAKEMLQEKIDLVKESFEITLPKANEFILVE